MAIALIASPAGAAFRPFPRDVPLPPPRPADLRPPAAPPLPAPLPPPPPSAPLASPTPPQPAPDEVAACDKLLADGTVRAARLPPFGQAGGCGIAVPVKLSAVVLAGKADVVLEPPVTLRCAMAAAVAAWVRSDLAPLVSARGGLAKLSGLGGYECRGRNRVAGAKLSEHAVGNAIDIGAVVLKDGSTARITDVAPNAALFAQVKLTACARFSTVLGPGSDGYHEDNLHLDIEARRGGTHICHWQLP